MEMKPAPNRRILSKLAALVLALLPSCLISCHLLSRYVYYESIQYFILDTMGRKLLFFSAAGLIAALMLLSYARLTAILTDEPKRRALRAILWALYVTLALSRQMAPVAESAPNKSVLWLLILSLCALVFFQFLSVPIQRRVVRAAALTGSLFSLFSVLGREIANHQEIGQIVESPFSFSCFLLALVGMGALYAMLLALAFRFCLSFSSRENRTKPFPCDKKAVLAFAALILICWLPYYLAEYPAVITADSSQEINAMLGREPLSNHHPFIHQLTLKPFLLLGEQLGSPNAGIGLYAFLQMIFLALCFSGCVCYLAKIGLGRGFCAAVLAFFALFMVNGIYSVTIWKDVPFAGFTLLLLMLLFEEARRPPDADPENKGKKRGRTLALVAVGFLFCTFRNNGYYAFLLGFPVFVLMNRRQWKRLAAIGVAVAVLVVSYQALIYNVLGVARSPAGETLSLPLQQVARTVQRHARELTGEEYSVLQEVFYDVDTLGEKYDPLLSDPVKDGAVFNSQIFAQDPLRYARLWARLGLRFPVAYLEAFLCQTYGYWYPDQEYWVFASYLFTHWLNLEQDPDLENARAALYNAYNDQVNTPVLSLLYSIGFMVWLAFLCFVLLLLKRRGRLASPMALLAGLWLTTLASPVFCEYRYLYALIVSVPLCLGVALKARPAGERS